MPIIQPPGFKLYLKLFKTALNNLNTKLIKLIIYINFTNLKINFETEFINHHLARSPWTWCIYTTKYILTCDIVDKYRYLPWNWKVIFKACTGQRMTVLTLEFMEQYLEPIVLQDPSLLNSCSLADIPIEWVKKYCDLDNLPNPLGPGGEPNLWYSQLSCNKNLTLDIIEKYIDKNWNWGSISRNNILTLEFIEKHIDIFKPVHWEGMSSNKNLTFEFVKTHLDKPWDYGVLFKQHNFMYCEINYILISIINEFNGKYSHRMTDSYEWIKNGRYC